MRHGDGGVLVRHQHRLRHLRSLRGEAIQGGAIVAVTSAVRGEGVSLTAANLALTAARSRDARVALVDCDLRRGGVGQLFGMEERAGLADVLTGKTEVGEALGRFHEGHLAVIAAETGRLLERLRGDLDRTRTESVRVMCGGKVKVTSMWEPSATGRSR